MSSFSEKKPSTIIFQKLNKHQIRCSKSCEGSTTGVTENSASISAVSTDFLAQQTVLKLLQY